MFIQEKVNKDHKLTTNRVDGIIFDSILEAQEASNLNEKLAEKEILDWRKQKKLSFYIVIENKIPVLKCNPTDNERRYGYFLENYYIDFEVDMPDGTIELIEVKGMQSQDWKRKWSMVQAVYGDDLNYSLKLKI